MSLGKEVVLASYGLQGNSYLAFEEEPDSVFLSWVAEEESSFCCFRPVWGVDKKSDLYEKPFLNNRMTDR